MKERILIAYISLLLGYNVSAQKQATHFSTFIIEFCKEYQTLNIPELEYDYKKYFADIPDTTSLTRQEQFFLKEQKGLKSFDYKTFPERDKIHYDLLEYECTDNLQRVSLERQWVLDGRNIPGGGLYSTKNNKEWYRLFIKRFTSLDVSPEEVYQLGISETQKVKNEINNIQKQLGFTNSAKFYQYLQSDTFLLKDKGDIIKRYARIDSTVRQNLYKIIDVKDIPPVYVIEWPNADKFTPPGMYVNRAFNAYNKDVFEFNFYNKTHNVRAMEWLYMHEAIPGHHLQSTIESREDKDNSLLLQLFIYPGNFEGWACYVEYLGKEIGMYQNPYSELGKWEWDLVRSVRLVLDVGIHYYGWDFNKAMAYWKANIPGQDAIAEREVTRITNWPGQVLSYKVGAHKIMEMKAQFEAKEKKSNSERKFHDRFLVLGMLPLQIMDKYVMAGE